MTVLSDLKSRVFSYYRCAPNIVKLLEMIADPMQDTRDACSFILGHLSIDTAEGQQLEYLGSIIGVSRPLEQETELFTLFGLGDIDDPENLYGFSDLNDPDNGGGYFASNTGLESQLNQDQLMGDEDFRFMIKQKAASYRKKMTVNVLFNYLLEFGSLCKIEEGDLDVEIEPYDYDDLDHWSKNYVRTRGFRPAGINVHFADNLRNKGTI